MSLASGSHILVLGTHILDLGQFQHAVLLGFGEGFAGDIGMDMNLEGFVILADDQAVADGVQIGTEGFQVGVLVLADDEHGIKGEGDVLVGQSGKVGLLLGLLAILLGHGQAAQLIQHTLQDDQEALAAGVYDTGLLQNGVLVDGVVQGDLAFLDGGLQHELKVVVLAGSAGGLGGSHTGNGQNGAFGGLHNGLVSGGDAEVQSDGQVTAIHGLVVLDGLGQTTEQQGQDNAGVTARAAQQCGGGHLSDLTHRGAGLFLQFGGGSGHGQTHIGTGVAVRDGEHVQVVDGLLLRVQSGGGVDHHSLKGSSINNVHHVKSSFLNGVRSAWSPHRHPRTLPSRRWWC